MNFLMLKQKFQKISTFCHHIHFIKFLSKSYCCVRYISSIISTHNRSILNPTKTNFGCNCRNRSTFWLWNNCLTPNIVYQANITNNVADERRVYLGFSETPFKDRYRNHLKDFNKEIHYTKNELSKCVWDLKCNNKEPRIS